MKSWIVAIFTAWAASSNAQPLGSASVDKLVEQLTPDAPKTRSLRNLTVAPKSVDLMVLFDFDSAKLQEASKPLLDNLASAMASDRLLTLNFSVEGHTDAKGSESYNLSLSQRRAQSVVDYLAAKGISKERLTSVGKGFREPLYQDRPRAAENRRVTITTLN